MAILAELPGSISVKAGPLQTGGLAGQILVMPDPLGAPVGTLSGDDSVAQAMKPQSYGVPQEVCIEVWVDGVQLPPGLIEAPITVTLNRRQPSTFALSLRTPTGLAAPAVTLGPPGGKARWDLYGVYRTGTGWHRISLISNGTADRVTARIDQDGERHVDIAGLDAFGRYGRRKVTTPDYRAGHGTDAGAVVVGAALLAGAPCHPLALGLMNKPFSVTDGDWMPALLPLLASYGRVARFDREGILEFPPEGYDPGARASLVLTNRDILLDGGTQAQFSAAVLTRVTITGTMQTEGDQAAVHTVIPGDVVTFSIYAPQVAAFAQASDGSLSATSAVPDPAALIETSRVHTVRRLRGDVPLWERVTTWGWTNQRAARYTLHADGTVDHAPCYLYAGAVADDKAEGYRLAAERYLPVQIKETSWHYAEDGYLLSVEVKTYAPRITLAAVKGRDNATDTWESSSWVAGRLTLGDGTGVIEAQEIMLDTSTDLPVFGPAVLPVSVETTTFGVLKRAVADPLVQTVGFLSGQEVAVDSWIAPQGALWLWADGTEHGVDRQERGRASSVTTTYVAMGASSHDQVVVTVALGRETEVVTSSGLQGYLPAATRDTTGLTPPPATEISGEWIAWALEVGHERAEQVSADQYVETPAEAQALARRRVIEGAAVPVTFQVLALWPLQPTMRVTIMDLGIRSVMAELLDGDFSAGVDLHLQSVSHQHGRDQRLLTTATGNWYPYRG